MASDETVAEELARSRHELAAAIHQVQHLEAALASSRAIGMAMGILMARHRLTEDQAFDQLRGMSSRRNVKLRDVATEVVHTGDWAPGPTAEAGAGAAPSAVVSTDGA